MDLEEKMAERIAELIKSNECTKFLLSTIPIGIYRINARNRKMTFVTGDIASLMGYDPQDFIEDSTLWWKRIHPNDKERIVGDQAALFECGFNVREYRFMRKDGTYCWILDKQRLLCDKDKSPDEIIGIWLDITERKQLEIKDQLLHSVSQSIRESRDLNEALSSILTSICEFAEWDYGETWIPNDQETFLTFGSTCNYCAKDVDDLISFSKKMILPPNVGLPGKVWASGKSMWIDNQSALCKANRADILGGHGFKAALGVPIKSDNKVIAVVVFFSIESRAEDKGMAEMVSAVAEQLTPVIQRKKAKEEIEMSRKQLLNLSAYLQSLIEGERKHIAREIHDDLGQALTVLKMDTAWLQKRLPETEEALIEKVGAMSKLLGDTIKTVQRISSGLRPSLLDHAGLAESIKWYVKEFQERSGIRCSMNVKLGKGPIGKDISISIYRIFQELLTNSARHSGATEVMINLKKESGKLVLKVSDNGKGITKKQINTPESLGLIGIRERAEFLGGECEITGSLEKGTKVTVTIPLKE